MRARSSDTRYLVLAAIVLTISDEREDRGALLQTVETMPLIRRHPEVQIFIKYKQFSCVHIYANFICPFSKKKKKNMNKLKKLSSAPPPPNMVHWFLSGIWLIDIRKYYAAIV